MTDDIWDTRRAGAATDELRQENEQLRAGYYSLTQRLMGLRMVQHIALDVATELDVDRLLSRILRSALFAVDGMAGSLLLLDPTGRELIFAVVEQGGGRALQGRRMSVENGLAGWVVRNNQPVIVNDAQKDERFFRQIPEGTGLLVTSLVCAPLVTHGQVIGALQILNKVDAAHFNDDDLDLLASFAAQSATAIENARLYQDLKRERDRLIAIEDEIHRRLARDLHDGPAQLLASIITSAEFIEKLLQREPAKVPGELEELCGLAHKALHQVRTLLFELRPVILETQGLVPALEMYMQRQREESGLAFHLDTRGFAGRLVARAEQCIFDILQEAMGNVKKHAQAQNAWIALAESDGRLLAGVRDDGRGFDVEKLRAGYDQRGSLGMLNMEERARSIGGSLSIQSRPGGTAVVLSVPLEALRPGGPQGPGQDQAG